jgi:phospholipid/cholesterol/gamma-HCH transport system substrate-binding protein
VLSRTTKIQLAIFCVIGLLALPVASLYIAKLPAALFGVGRYIVKLELPESGNLYPSANVDYRGTAVGKVQSVDLTDTGVEAVLSLNSAFHIPSELKAEVHSRLPIGEQYVALLPRNGTSPPLKDGDVIRQADTSVPPEISALIQGVTTALQALPHDNLKTVIDESYRAVGGLGPELSRLVKGSTELSIDARANLDPLVALIDKAPPVLDSQAETSDSIQAWASHLAAVTTQLHAHDRSLAGIVDTGGPALAETRQLVERLQPTLPLALANLVPLSEVARTYQNDVEQTLVMLPQLVANHQNAIVANANTKQDYASFFINLGLNLNIPTPCTTGYLPAQQIRNPALQDAPAPPAGDLYCRVPQDSQIDVRGVHNIPCETVSGKRAPTVKMCESDEQYVPLNDGYNWKGDPNSTLSGQDIPQLPPGSPPAPAGPPGSSLAAGLGSPPIAAAQYNPATGTYTGPDGKQYTPSELAQPAPKDKTWQTMLLPPGN